MCGQSIFKIGGEDFKIHLGDLYGGFLIFKSKDGFKVEASWEDIRKKFSGFNKDQLIDGFIDMIKNGEEYSIYD